MFSTDPEKMTSHNHTGTRPLKLGQPGRQKKNTWLQHETAQWMPQSSQPTTGPMSQGKPSCSAGIRGIIKENLNKLPEGENCTALHLAPVQ